jgi:putative membrane-bound dehydrogenase-like protein
MRVVVLASLAMLMASVVVAGPLSPEESLAAFVVHPDVRVELVACEPEVVDPVAIAFDEDGRLWVAEMRDYPNGPTGGGKPLSRIRVLKDLDQDGRYESATTFADGLPFVTGLQPWRGGVIVTLAGRIDWLKDTDGDDVADLRETWFTGFAEDNPQLRANDPTITPDGRIVVANGLRGGMAKVVLADWPNHGQEVSLRQRDLSFDPFTGQAQAILGNGQFGLTLDEFGNRFVCDNRHPCRHVVFETHDLASNPWFAPGELVHDVVAAGEQSRVYPLSSAWTTSHLHEGQFTAACAPHLYSGDVLPKDFHGNLFVCEPTGSLVHREILSPDGATFRGRPGREGIEFLASPDAWFRPVFLADGPDGALYVADMYRAVIEHPDWVPDELKNRPDQRHGDDRGRIWRIVPANRTKRPAGLQRWHNLSSESLVDRLAATNGWVRATALRLLTERRDASAWPQLKLLAQGGSLAEARALALSLLVSQGQGASDVLAAALEDSDPRVRRLALRIIAGSGDPQAHAKLILQAVRDRSEAVRFQALLTWGQCPPGDDMTKVLAAVAQDDLADTWLRTAVLMASAKQAAGVLRELVSGFDAETPLEPGRAEFVIGLSEMIGVRGRTDEIRATIELAAAMVQRGGPKQLALAMPAGLGVGTARGGKRLASLIQATSAEWNTLVTTATDVAKNPQSQIADRVRAVQTLRFLEGPGSEDVLLHLATSAESAAVRVAAIEGLAAFDVPRAADAFTERFVMESPEVRGAILDFFLSNGQRSERLLELVESKRLRPGDIDPQRAARLTRSGPAALRERAQRLLAPSPDRQRVLEQYASALTNDGNSMAGRAVFRERCAACHRLEGHGHQVGPDISDTRTKSPKELLVSILDPNRAVDGGFLSYVVLTADGKVQSGVLVSETNAAVTLRGQDGQAMVISRDQIEEFQSSGVSFMPEGLERSITPNQMTNLIAYLKNWRYLNDTPGVPEGESDRSAAQVDAKDSRPEQ